MEHYIEYKNKTVNRLDTNSSGRSYNRKHCVVENGRYKNKTARRLDPNSSEHSCSQKQYVVRSGHFYGVVKKQRM